MFIKFSLIALMISFIPFSAYGEPNIMREFCEKKYPYMSNSQACDAFWNNYDKYCDNTFIRFIDSRNLIMGTDRNTCGNFKNSTNYSKQSESPDTENIRDILNKTRIQLDAKNNELNAALNENTLLRNRLTIAQESYQNDILALKNKISELQNLINDKQGLIIKLQSDLNLSKFSSDKSKNTKPTDKCLRLGLIKGTTDYLSCSQTNNN